MARVTSYAAPEAARLTGVEQQTLEAWLHDGKIVHQRDRSGAIRISIFELPALRALRDDRPLCSNCRNTRRDPRGGDCLWCNRRASYGDCKSCGAVNELLTTDSFAECISCRTRNGPARAKSLHWLRCFCRVCNHSHPGDCEACGCCGR